MAKSNSTPLTLERLREVLAYNSDTGEFTWKQRQRGRKTNGIVGSITRFGYHKIKIDYKEYRSNRLAWFYVHGEWPTFYVDHINGIKTDNRISNLRDVPQTINAQNRRKASVRSESGVIGAMRVPEGFRAKIVVNGEIISLGTYKTAEEAHSVYLEAKRRLHPGCTI